MTQHEAGGDDREPRQELPPTTTNDDGASATDDRVQLDKHTAPELSGCVSVTDEALWRWIDDDLLQSWMDSTVDDTPTDLTRDGADDDEDDQIEDFVGTWMFDSRWEPGET